MAAAKKLKTKAATNSTINELKSGDKAPSFSLPTDGGGKIALKDLKGRNIVLYFYPKDDTSGCTAQACDFRDNMPAFGKRETVIIGISRDTAAQHDKFKEKYDLNFTLASDEEAKICAAYNVWKEKSMYGKKYMGIERSTFLIDGKGVIRQVWRKVKVPGHGAEVLAALKDM